MATCEVRRRIEPTSPAPHLIDRLETLEEVTRQGRVRLYPTITNPNWLVLRKRREIFKNWLARLQSKNLRVLDVGGRIQPYRPLLKGNAQSYVAIDMRRTPLVTVIARGEQIPVASLQFDLVICTQVLEYVAEPASVIAEIYRVLKPGACLMLSVPAIFPRDSERDTWRFMPHSLRILLHSFRDVEIVPEGGSIAGFIRTMCIGASMVRPSLLGNTLKATLIPLLNLIAFCLEAMVPSSNDQFSANFSVFAKK